MSGQTPSLSADPVAQLLGSIRYRLQLAGGWIDQPFVSRHNPNPPGSIVVVQIEPSFRPMSRSGIASSTRAVAEKLWAGKLPDRPLPELRRIRPQIYIVNQDGDKGGKREYCRQQGIEYVVLKRAPAPGLPSRHSTELRRSYSLQDASYAQTRHS